MSPVGSPETAPPESGDDGIPGSPSVTGIFYISFSIN